VKASFFAIFKNIFCQSMLIRAIIKLNTIKALMVLIAALLFFPTAFAEKIHANDWKAKSENAEYIHRTLKAISDVIVYDIYSPPVASRTYAYVSVTAYETVLHLDSSRRSLAGQLHDLKPLPPPEKNKEYCYTLSAVWAMLHVAKTMVISEEKINDFEKTILDEFRNNGIPQNIYENSISYAKQVYTHILAWSQNDHYKETRSMPKYAVTEDAGSWKPTPPAYMKAVEPNWNRIRTFITDSAQQFKPSPPPPFSIDKKSDFYKKAFAVYQAGINITEEEKNIANFWDCNPFKMNIRGHVMYATKKISPGGHWMNITCLAARQQNAGVVQTAEAYACLSVIISDCFSSCWDEKYRSQVIRPETYINEYIDTSWMPLLQTPPFPEYTSGHSIVSSGAAVFLTHFFGDNFSFIDSTEIEFGLPARKFGSFNEAAREAAISRFYGGIHYMPAIENGFISGEAIGKYFVENLKTRKE
jgi:PAP2 superfamily